VKYLQQIKQQLDDATTCNCVRIVPTATLPPGRRCFKIKQRSSRLLLPNNHDRQLHKHKSLWNYVSLGLSEVPPLLVHHPQWIYSPLASHSAICEVTTMPSSERWLNSDLIAAGTWFWLLGPARTRLSAKCCSLFLTPSAPTHNGLHAVTWQYRAHSAVLFLWTWNIPQHSRNETNAFRKWLCSRVQVKMPVLLGPTEGANHSPWIWIVLWYRTQSLDWDYILL
jgi:hypothetical protein